MPLRRVAKSDFWHFDFAVEGVRFRGSTRTTDKRTAERIEAKKREQVLLGGPAGREMTFDVAAEKYYQERAQHQASAADAERQLMRLTREFGAKLLSRITDVDVSAYVAARRAQPITSKRKAARLPAPATVNREVELLRRVMRKAELAWKVNVARINWHEHLLPEPQERVRELTAAEETRLFEKLRADFHPLVRFCLLTGARFGSAIKLTWASVDHVAGTITLRTKGNRNHVVPISDAVSDLLAGEKGKHPIFVFVYQCARSRGQRRRGQFYPFSKNGWRKPWYGALAAAGIEDFRFHDTRHTAATRVLRKSGNLKIVQKMLGHSTITTTARYAHAQIDDVREAMNAAARQKNVEAAPAKDRKAES